MNNFGFSSGFILDEGQIIIPGNYNLALRFCHYNKQCYRDNLFKDLKILFPERISKSVEKRKSEYLAGRYVAKSALNNLAINDFNVLTGRHRCPVWPNGVIGSISHTQCKAYAVTTYSHYFNYIGIDCEELIDDKTATNIHSMIVNGNELKLVMNSGYDFSLALTVIFSAKESLFKALYPTVGYYFDFSAATITSFSEADQNFELTLNYSLSSNLTKGCQFKGWFQRKLGEVLTLIAT